jgi:hypothetical protein
MTSSEAIAKFDTATALALALGCTQAAISQWGEYPPLLRQLELERLTRGALRAEPECDKYRVAA